MAVAEILTPTQPDFRYRHLSDVTSTLCGLWRRRLYTDLTLVANGKNVRCHRVVLASASPYFHSRLFNGKKESGTDKIFISDVPRDVLNDVLDFVYSGQCRLTAENAEDLLRAAAIFELGALRDMCDYFLKDHVHEKNALKLYKMARATKSPRMEEKAREVILNNFERLSHTKLFKQLSHKELISIIRRDRPMTPSPDPATPSPDPLTSSGGDPVTTLQDQVATSLDTEAPNDNKEQLLASSVGATNDGATPREEVVTIDMMAPSRHDTATTSSLNKSKRVAFAIRSSADDVATSSESGEAMSGNAATDAVTSGDVSVTSETKAAAPSEDIICEAVMSWINIDAARRTHVLHRILKHVRLVEVGRETLTNLAEDKEGLAEDEVSLQMIQEAVALKDKLAAAEAAKAKATEYEEEQAADQEQQTQPPKPKQDDILVMIGGAEEHGSRFRSRQRVHAFNLNLRKWFSLTPLPLGADSGTAYCVKGNDIFVSGAGDNRQGLVRYHASSNTWKVLAPMLVGRRGHCLVESGPYLYVLGGITEGEGTAPDISSACAYASLSPRSPQAHLTAAIERYDLRSNSWQAVGALAETVWGASAVSFRDKIQVFGGFHAKDRPTAVVQTFNPGSGSCIVSSQLPFPLALSRAVVTTTATNNNNNNRSGSVYILGPSGNVLCTRDCWRFKVAAAIPDFRRALFGMAGDGDSLYVAGGRHGDRVHKEILVLDMQHGTMVVLPQRLPQPLWGAAFVKVALDRDLMVQPGSEECQY